MKAPRFNNSIKYPKRLLKLASALEADARRKKGLKFDFGDWGSSKSEPEVSCGTTACAFGYAAISGMFKRQGLNFTHGGPAYDLYGRQLAAQIGFTLNNEYLSGTEAAAEIFGIDYDDAHFLFVSHKHGRTKYVGKDANLRCMRGAKAERAVAKRIRSFIAGKCGRYENQIAD